MLVEHKIEFSSNGITVTQRFGPDDSQPASNDAFEAQSLTASFEEHQTAQAAKSSAKAKGTNGGPGNPMGGGAPGIFIGPIIFTLSPEKQS